MRIGTFVFLLLAKMAIGGIGEPSEQRLWGKKMDVAFGKLMGVLPAEKKTELRKDQDRWNKEDDALSGRAKLDHTKKRIYELEKRLYVESERIAKAKAIPVEVNAIQAEESGDDDLPLEKQPDDPEIQR